MFKKKLLQSEEANKQIKEDNQYLLNEINDIKANITYSNENMTYDQLKNKFEAKDKDLQKQREIHRIFVGKY